MLVVTAATLICNHVTVTATSNNRQTALLTSIYRVAQKNVPNLRNYNNAYTLWGEISFGTFVDQHVLLLTYKFQWSLMRSRTYDVRPCKN